MGRDQSHKTLVVNLLNHLCELDIFDTIVKILLILVKWSSFHWDLSKLAPEKIYEIKCRICITNLANFSLATQGVSQHLYAKNDSIKIFQNTFIEHHEKTRNYITLHLTLKNSGKGQIKPKKSRVWIDLLIKDTNSVWWFGTICFRKKTLKVFYFGVNSYKRIFGIN